MADETQGPAEVSWQRLLVVTPAGTEPGMEVMGTWHGDGSKWLFLTDDRSKAQDSYLDDHLVALSPEAQITLAQNIIEVHGFAAVMAECFVEVPDHECGDCGNEIPLDVFIEENDNDHQA